MSNLAAVPQFDQTTPIATFTYSHGTGCPYDLHVTNEVIGKPSGYASYDQALTAVSNLTDERFARSAGIFAGEDGRFHGRRIGQAGRPDGDGTPRIRSVFFKEQSRFTGFPRIVPGERPQGLVSVVDGWLEIMPGRDLYSPASASSV